MGIGPVSRIAKLPPAGTEALDSRDVDPAIARATLRDITRTNTWLGGRTAVEYGFGRLLAGRRTAGPLTLLDVASGTGDVPQYLAEIGLAGVPLRGIALDHLQEAVGLARARGLSGVVADCETLPVRSRAVDVVIASLVLHHLPRTRVVPFLRSLDRIARLGVVVSDLQRSVVARYGLRLAAALLDFHPATRYDGLVSLRRGFTRRELEDLLAAAGIRGTVRRRRGWRLVAFWRTDHADG